MFKYSIIFLFLLPFFSFAQQDYIILHKGDTLFGKVKRGNLAKNHITLKSGKVKQKIHLREISEWKSGEMPVTVISGTTEKRTYWIELLLVADGRKKLYWDIFNVEVKKYYVANEGKYIQLTNQNIDSMLLSELTICKRFIEKYGQRKILLSEIEEVVKYYNKYCEIEQEK